MSRIPRLLPFLVAFLAIAAVPYAGRADEPAPKPKPQPEEPDEEEDEDEDADPAAKPDPTLDDKADDKISFADEVNLAIELGSRYLLGRPYGPKQVPAVRKEGKEAGQQKDPFPVPRVGTLPGWREEDKVEGAHWGFIDSPVLYGNADGNPYREPAGPTALALYAVLKCGEDPNHPVIKRGFAWLRQPHHVEKTWSALEMRDRWWTATIGGSSYELSAMILALTAKYDTHKRAKNTQAKRKAGKLKITDKEERLWLEQMVEMLVRRRGEPATEPVSVSRSDVDRLADYRKEVNLPPENRTLRDKDRLGWRYNRPSLNMVKGGRPVENFHWVGGLTAPGSNQDLSSTQLAALALFNAHQFGVRPEVGPSVWGDIARMTLDHQEKEGPEHTRFDPLAGSGRYASAVKVDHARGFMYIPGSTHGAEGKATGAMTAAGVANLVMARTVLLEDEDGLKEWERRGFGATDPKTGQNVVDTGIWDGLAWLDKNWSAFDNRNGGGNWHIYYLYALERAMDLLGKNLVGKHLWYTEGARHILDRLKKTKSKNALEKGREIDSGYWDTDSSHEPQDVLDTAFAILFLKRATKDMIPPPSVTGGDAPPADNR